MEFKIPVLRKNSVLIAGAGVTENPTDWKLTPLRHGRDDAAHLKYALLHVLERVLCQNTNLRLTLCLASRLR